MPWTDPYKVLGIVHGAELSEVKQAYRKALLNNHPDKNGSHMARFTIDDVNRAYRQVIDSEQPHHSTESIPVSFNELVDLGEFDFDGKYFCRKCRCGATGYTLTEDDLEANGDADEIAVQCNGCSIWILVQYAIAEN